MLALISGRGLLPSLVASFQADAPLICALDGYRPENLQPDITFRLEHLGSLINDLKARDITEVCFCGGIERPPFDAAQLDAETLPLVPVMMQAMAAGDDGALRAVMTLFENAGFRVRAAHDLAPDLVSPEGVLSKAQPGNEMQQDLDRAVSVLTALGPLDVGQACVVGAGQVWGIETIGGTDHMLSTLPAGVSKAHAILVKMPKEGQDLRADMPAIGPETIQAVAEAGLAGLVIQAGAVLMLDRESTCAAADAAGVVLWSRASL